MLERFLRKGEYLHRHGIGGSEVQYVDVRKTTPNGDIRVAQIRTGGAREEIPEDLLVCLLRAYPRPGAFVHVGTIHLVFREWCKRAGQAEEDTLERLISAGYLLTYQGDKKYGRAEPGELLYFLGDKGLALWRERTRVRRHIQDAWLTAWQHEVANLTPLTGMSPPASYERLRTFLSTAVQDLATGRPISFPEGVYSAATHRSLHVRLALSFLTAVAQRVETKECFEWKEIGACYKDHVGASKLFDRSQERLLTLLSATTGVEPDAIGMASLGSLYPVFGGGMLEYQVGNETRKTAHGVIWSITSDELLRLKTCVSLGTAVILTENRSFLLKAVYSGWVRNQQALVLGLDGQPRKAFLNFLTQLRKPAIVWLDSDRAALKIGARLAKLDLDLHWVVPSSFAVGRAPTLTTYNDWVTITSHLIQGHAIEQESYMGGPQTWTRLLSQIADRAVREQHAPGGHADGAGGGRSEERC